MIRNIYNYRIPAVLFLYLIHISVSAASVVNVSTEQELIDSIAVINLGSDTQYSIIFSDDITVSGPVPPLDIGEQNTITFSGNDLLLSGNSITMTVLTGNLIINNLNIRSDSSINITVADGFLELNSDINVENGDLTLTVSNGNLLINGAVSSAENISINVVSGSIVINSDITSGNSILMSVDNGTITVGGSITAAVNGEINIIKNGVGLTFGGNNTSATVLTTTDGTLSLNNNISLAVDPDTGTVSINNGNQEISSIDNTGSSTTIFANDFKIVVEGAVVNVDNGKKYNMTDVETVINLLNIFSRE